MADSWPVELPQSFLIDGLSVTQQPNSIRQDMDAGPAFQRRRFTAVSEYVRGTMRINAAQYAIFWDFYNNTLNGGIDEFTWVHPFTGAAVTMQFNVSEVPTASSVGADDLVNMQLSLEILP